MNKFIVSLLAIIVGLATSAIAQTQWRAGHIGAAGYYTTQADAALAEEVKSATNGNLVITVYPSGTAGYKSPDTLYAISNNLYEMGTVFGSHVAGEEPILELFDLPMFVPADYDFREGLWKAMYPDFAKLLDEKYGVHLIALFQLEPRMIYTRKPLQSLSGLRGMKIRAMGPVETSFTQRLGAVPVPVNWTELYTALQQGMIDGHWTADVAQHDSKLFEVTSYIFDIGNAGAGSMSLVNSEALNDLEPEMRQTFLRLAGEQHRQRLFDASRAAAKRGRQQLVQDGMNPVPVLGADRAHILEQVEPIVSEWSAKLDPASKRIYGKARQMIEAYNKGRN